MIISALLILIIPLIISLPFWLPNLVIQLRMSIFTKVNGEEGIQVPGKEIKASEFKKIYANKSLKGRSKGANLSNLFWYWLAPGPEMHQEHIEEWDNYKEIAAVTKNILSISNEETEQLWSKYESTIFSQKNIKTWKVIRLRDFLMPISTSFFYELVFGEECTEEEKKIILKHSNNVVNSLKGCALRHMAKRNKLTELLMEKLEKGDFKHHFPKEYTTEQKALFLQGVFFTTAIVQMTDALTHMLLVLARHPEVQKKLNNSNTDKRYYDNVISETLRLYPLFGIAHRIATDDIQIDENRSIAKGSVVCFNYPEYHKIGFKNPDKFIPERWETITKREANYIPFGIGANRACPASHMSLIIMEKMLSNGIQKFGFSSSVEHTRSLPNRGACIIISKEHSFSNTIEKILLAFLKTRDYWETLRTSIIQLVYGFIMVLHAKDLKLADNYYKKPQNGNTISPAVVSKS